jgi:hypothetical protein
MPEAAVEVLTQELPVAEGLEAVVMGKMRMIQAQALVVMLEL